jgi:hypothetical protein
METSKLSLLLSLAGAAALQLHAQPASPEAQNKALELLRQTISQEPSPTASAPQPVVVTPTPAPAVTPAVPVSGDQQQQALMLLRQTMAQQPEAAAPPKSRASHSSAKPAKPKSSGSTSATVKQAPAPDTAAPVQASPAGPTTKQQRLADLLEQYRADKLTPAEYQAERARILAEP